MEELFRTIPEILDKTDMSEEIMTALLASAWKRSAGESLCGHTAVTGLEGKTLKIAVRDGIWKRHLESLAGQMIFKINSLLRSPAVTYIEFHVDEEAVACGIRKTEADKEANAEFEKIAARERSGRIADFAGTIEDVELRKLFISAAANCIARKEMRKQVL